MKLSVRAVGKFAMMASLVFSVALTARAEAPSARCPERKHIHRSLPRVQ